MTSRLSLKTQLALLTTIVLWASAFTLIRVSLESYSPGGMALLRFLVASIVMWFIYQRRTDRRSIRGIDLLLSMAIGAIGIGWYNIGLAYGELVVPSGIAGFIASQTPVVIAVLSIVFLHEKMHWTRLSGLALSVLGMVLIALSRGLSFSFSGGVACILFACFSASVYFILQKSLLKKYHFIDLTTYAVWGATLFLLIFSHALFLDVQHASLKATVSVIYLGLLPGSIAYLTWAYVLSQIPATRAASFLYFMPILAAVLGCVFLNEKLPLLAIVGGFVALLGVFVVNQSYRMAKNSASTV